MKGKSQPDPSGSRKENGADQPEFPTGGESQGGAQPGAKESSERRSERGSSFRGGQSERAYHGSGQLGDQQVTDDPNPNATATD
jgi:hypothetical protein